MTHIMSQSLLKFIIYESLFMSNTFINAKKKRSRYDDENETLLIENGSTIRPVSKLTLPASDWLAEIALLSI